jgi:type II secretory pathway pseudopilin PulG
MLQNTHRRFSQQQGFTIIELVAALAITALLGIAIVSVIIGVLESNGKTQINAATTVRAQHVLTAFETDIKQAEEIVAADKHSVMFFYRADNRCELHLYKFIPDDQTENKLALFHTIRSGFVPGTVDCSTLKTNILTSDTPALTEQVELRNIGLNSRFYYFAENGDFAPRPGDPEFRLVDQISPCRISAVQMVLQTTAIAGDSTVLNENTIKTSVQSGAKGVACLPN